MGFEAEGLLPLGLKPVAVYESPLGLSMACPGGGRGSGTYKMKRYLVPTKRASREAATSPTTGEAARDRTVKAARAVDENMLADGSVETDKRQLTLASRNKAVHRVP